MEIWSGLKDLFKTLYEYFSIMNINELTFFNTNFIEF